MFKVNNKDIRTTPKAYIMTYFTPSSSVFIVNFEHIEIIQVLRLSPNELNFLKFLG